MKKLTLFIAAAAIVGFAGAASAGNHNGNSKGNPGHGNQNCYLTQAPGTGDFQAYKNPGKMFQALRKRDEKNPKEFVDGWSGADSVKDLIDARCGVNSFDPDFEP